MMRWIFSALTIVLLLTLGAPAFAQGAIKVSTSNLTNDFPNGMTFALEASSTAEINNVALIVRLNGIASSSRFIPRFQPGPSVSTKFTWDFQGRAAGGYVPPGVSGEYWWHLEDASGNKIDSPHQTFRLDDITQKWLKLENNRVAVFWYNGGSNFGQSLFDRANSAMDFLTKDLNVQITRQLQILIYGNRNDFVRSSEPGQPEWTGGRTYSDYGVILIHIETSNLPWGLEATSHELTHAVVHEKLGSGLADLTMPHWMDEGLAVYNQTTEHGPDSQFEFPLRRAIQTNALLTLRAISSNFPADSDMANLAYGESYSAVAFMFKKYDKSKVSELLNGFKQGTSTDGAFKQVLGVTMDEFENLWRKDIGAPLRDLAAAATATPQTFPTFSFSTAETPVPGGARPTATPVRPTEVAVAATQPAPPTEVPAGGNAPSGTQAPGLCGGVFGIAGIGLLGMFLRRRRAGI